MEGTPGKTLGANTSEGVLANFFNSLLTKKTGGVSPGLVQSPATLGGGSPQPETDCKFFLFSLINRRFRDMNIFLIISLSLFNSRLHVRSGIELKIGRNLFLHVTILPLQNLIFNSPLHGCTSSELL